MSSTIDEYKEIYDILDGELKYVFHLNAIYGQLFSEKENLDLLNATSGDVFAIFQQLAHKELIIYISRTLENKKTGNKNNLTLYSLLDKRFKCFYSQKELEKKLSDVRKSASFESIIKIRNKRIAHSDISKLSLEDEVPKVSYIELELVLRDIADVMNFTSSKSLGLTVLYHEAITHLKSDGNSLLTALKKVKESNQKFVD